MALLAVSAGAASGVCGIRPFVKGYLVPVQL